MCRTSHSPHNTSPKVFLLLMRKPRFIEWRTCLGCGSATRIKSQVCLAPGPALSDGLYWSSPICKGATCANLALTEICGNSQLSGESQFSKAVLVLAILDFDLMFCICELITNQAGCGTVSCYELGSINLVLRRTWCISVAISA